MAAGDRMGDRLVVGGGKGFKRSIVDKRGDGEIIEDEPHGVVAVFEGAAIGIADIHGAEVNRLLLTVEGVGAKADAAVTGAEIAALGIAAAQAGLIVENEVDGIVKARGFGEAGTLHDNA